MSNKNTVESDSLTDAETQVPATTEGDDDGISAFMDMGRLMHMSNDGELDAYRGQHVAMLDGKVVGSDKDPSELLQRLSREHNVPENRIALWFVNDGMDRLRITPATDMQWEPGDDDPIICPERTPDESATVAHAVLTDMGRLLQMNNAGELVAYPGQHVAMIDGRVVGNSRYLRRLIRQVAREQNVPEDRVATMWISSADEF